MLDVLQRNGRTISDLPYTGRPFDRLTSSAIAVVIRVESTRLAQARSVAVSDARIGGDIQHSGRGPWKSPDIRLDSRARG